MRRELYRRSYDRIHLLCVDEEKAQVLMKEVHEGVCGPHMNGRMLAKKIVCMGYFWTTMIGDCAQFVKKCHQCQIHANMDCMLPVELH